MGWFSPGRSREPISLALMVSWLLPSRSSSQSYFFFQAEDGIRNLTVTGVQTCALPISWELQSYCPARHIAAPTRGYRRDARPARSEERRVGKECKTRAAPSDKRKKSRSARPGAGCWSKRRHTNEQASSRWPDGPTPSVR